MTTHSYGIARQGAERLVELLAPHCERIEIAGSLRRRVERVKDIEFVCVPKMARDLFGEAAPGEPHEVETHVRRLLLGGHVGTRVDARGRQRLGARYLALVTATRIPVDLFCVLPPAQWGAILAIRTGPAAYSRRLVTECQARGLRCVDGRLVWEDESSVATPEERDFIEACGLPFVQPWERS